ncbi:lipoyltransferase like protein [Zymoseptoria brevis]|uniref:Octanoyltransferase n=1 Tax=Zymoseptoria brevis TaxID=1047168 RepID=A0A0F4GKT7_9PEZI|nr:lipoyltransferase like protein [Zymoseptoria brevis]
MTILRHLRLPSLTSYAHAAALQSRLVAAQLAHKASRSPPIPEPTIITAQFHPVYTCGRREVGSVSAEQKAYLTETTPGGRAEFVEALRGGQTTFHGPGQLVAYPIIDLKRHGITPRCYVRLLEKSVIRLCGELGVQTKTTEHPGVWTMDEERKICAVGVHLRRNVTSHGLGLNVSTEMGWFERIVGCGLEGKGATSLAIERAGREDLGVEEVGGAFVRVFGELMDGVDAVAGIGEEDVE